MRHVFEYREIVDRISCEILGNPFHINIEYDRKYGNRVYIQMIYNAPCTKGTEQESWKGRKYYLSEYMTADEVVKTCYAAFEAAVKHEIMEGFKVDGKILFNPHVNFEELLKITDKEITRA